MRTSVLNLPVKAADPRHSMEAMRERREFVEMVERRMARWSEDRPLAEDIVRACLVKLDNTLMQILRERARDAQMPTGCPHPPNEPTHLRES